MEERLALRSSDPKMWEDVTKQLWIGVVKRYQSDMIEEPEAKAPRKDYSSAADEAIDRLGLMDMEIERPLEKDNPQTQVDTKKQDFANSIT